MRTLREPDTGGEAGGGADSQPLHSLQGRRGASLDLAHPARVFWIIAITVVALDQITKAMVRSAMTVSESIPLWEGVFHLTFVRNTGAAFGLMPGQRLLFVGTSLVVLAFVAAFWRRDRPTAWPIVIPIALVAGGAVGNLIDRAFIGRVTDFFHFTLIDFPVFNIADSAIVVGVIMLMAWLLFGPDPAKDDAEPEPDELPETQVPDDES